MASYFIILTNATGSQRLRIDLANKMINIKNLIEHQYQRASQRSILGSALASTLGSTWRSFDEVSTLLSNMGADAQEIHAFMYDV